MEAAYAVDWLNLLLRWGHVIAGIAWIGSSFYFIWLDLRLNVPPRNPESLKPAHEWAQTNNIAVLPLSICTEELLALGLGANQHAVWRITSPATGDVVSGSTPVVGTASFDPNVVEFYKIELGIPSGADVQWLTLGETHNTPVVNGVLEVLQADGLPPGKSTIEHVRQAVPTPRQTVPPAFRLYTVGRRPGTRP